MTRVEAAEECAAGGGGEGGMRPREMPVKASRRESVRSEAAKSSSAAYGAAARVDGDRVARVAGE